MTFLSSSPPCPATQSGLCGPCLGFPVTPATQSVSVSALLTCHRRGCGRWHAQPLQRSHRRCVPLDLNDGRLLEFTPNNQSFDQLASFQCFLYNLTSTGAPGTKSGWNFSLCTVFHD